MSAAARPANPARGEASLRVGGATIRLRPSFAALVAAEAELGSLIALVERAAGGSLTLTEIACLFWHCAAQEPDAPRREEIGAAIVAVGLAAVTPSLRIILQQIIEGTA